MVSNITYVEIFHVSAIILAGAYVCHLLLLRVWRRIASHRRNVVSHAHHQLGDHKPHMVESYDSLDEKHSDYTPQLIKPQSKCRGLLSDLPPRHTRVNEDLWQVSEKQRALHNLFIISHEENEQFTYLGSKTFFDGDTTSAQMFGWHRLPGLPTVQLGEIACLNVHSGKICLRVALHPEDAGLVCESGWGVLAASSVTAKVLSNIKQSKSVWVELVAPRSEAELVEVTRTVLEASIWWVAGAEKEDV